MAHHSLCYDPAGKVSPTSIPLFDLCENGWLEFTTIPPSHCPISQDSITHKDLLSRIFNGNFAHFLEMEGFGIWSVVVLSHVAWMLITLLYSLCMLCLPLVDHSALHHSVRKMGFV